MFFCLVKLLSRTPVKCISNRMQWESAPGPKAKGEEKKNAFTGSEVAVQHGAHSHRSGSEIDGILLCQRFGSFHAKAISGVQWVLLCSKVEKRSVAALCTARWPALHIKMKNLPGADSVCLTRRATSHCG